MGGGGSAGFATDDVATLPVPVPDRRAVAVAAAPGELLSPGSALVRALEGFPRADVLIAADDRPGEPDLDDRDDDDASDDLRAAVAALGHPDLVAHRLALPAVLVPTAEDDLVAALSELIGFDPEPGVHCLAPAVSPAAALSRGGAERAVAERAAVRVAGVYGLPLLRYRTVGLPAVDHETA